MHSTTNSHHVSLSFNYLFLIDTCALQNGFYKPDLFVSQKIRNEKQNCLETRIYAAACKKFSGPVSVTDQGTPPNTKDCRIDNNEPMAALSDSADSRI